MRSLRGTATVYPFGKAQLVAYWFDSDIAVMVVIRNSKDSGFKKYKYTLNKLSYVACGNLLDQTAETNELWKIHDEPLSLLGKTVILVAQVMLHRHRITFLSEIEEMN